MRKTLLLSLLLLLCGVVANAQDYYISLKFVRNGQTVTITAEDQDGTPIEGLTSSYEGTALANVTVNPANGILRPNANFGNGVSSNMTFTINGLPNYTFDKAGLQILALDSGGATQANNARYCNVDIQMGTSTENVTRFAYMEDMDITEGGKNKMRETATVSAMSTSEPLVIRLDISRGVSNATSNGGCFFGLSEIRLYALVPANPEDVQTAIAEAEAALALTGVGYPTETSEARTALRTAIDNIGAMATPSLGGLSTLTAAIATYKSSTNVNMPEDGKTYTFTGVLHDGRKRYLNYDGTSAYTLVDYTEGDALPSTAQFICRKDGDHYVFTNNAGKYFLWFGSKEGYDGNDGVQDAYDEHTHFTIDKLVKGTNTNVVVDSDAELFGYMCIKGQRNNSDSGYQQSYFILKTASGLDQASAQFFNNGFSSALLIEEVTTDSPSQVKFSANLSGVGYVATYSAKYPSVVPENEGIVAYYASQNTGSNVTMTPIEGAIPANTGVVLISESEQTVGMAPLAAAAPEALTTNLLRHSAGAAATVSAEEGKTAYILANGSEGVGFYAHDGSATQLKMNKSYLVIDTPTGGNAVKLVFGGTATGIEDAVEADDAAAPVYDLSGRKVSAPVKGGIYVKNGKKIVF